MPSDHQSNVILPDGLPDFRERQLLLVEDSLHDANLVALATEGLRGIRVHHVCNAVQAHDFLRKCGCFHDAPTPDLVLVDLHLPIFDGTSVLRFIRESFGLSTVPVVILTGSIDIEERMQCETLGAPVFDKPGNWSTWRSRITAILRLHLEGVASGAGAIAGNHPRR